MATGVFGNGTGKPIVLRAGKAIVKCGGTTLIALGVQISYQRTVEVLPTLGEKRVLSIGEGTGTFSAETVLAKGNDVMNAMHLGDDGCAPFSMSLTLQGGTCDASGKTVTAHNCVASAVTVSAQGGRGMIAQGVQVTFTAMTIA